MNIDKMLETSQCNYTSSNDEMCVCVEAKLKELKTEELEIQMKMSLLSQQTHLWSYNLSKKLTHINKLEQQFYTHSTELSHTLQHISFTSENITNKVRGLNSEQIHLETILTLISNIQEVYGALEIIEQSMIVEEYEQAVSALITFQRLIGIEDHSEFILDITHTLDMDDTHTHTSQQLLTILNINDKECLHSIYKAKMKLIEIVQNNFQMAIKNGDKFKFSKFSKLLSPLGLHTQAKTHYFQFLKDIFNQQTDTHFQELIKQKSDKNHINIYDSVSYSDIISKLFIAVDDLITDHKENIEREFGPSYFIQFCRSLQEEVDTKAIIILDKFATEKQSTLMLKIDQVHMKIEIKKIVMTLDELSLLSKLCQNFDQFIRSYSRSVLRTISSETDIIKELEGSKYNKNDGLLQMSALSRRLQELMGSYVSLEYIFMQKSIQRASEETDEIAWDESDQKTSTMVDDIFFILQESLSRAIYTYDVYAACAVANHITSLLSMDVKAQLESKMNSSHNYYLEYVQKLNSLKEFKILDSFPDTIKKSIEKRNVIYGASISWIHTINDIQACVEYLSALQQKSENEFNHQFSHTTHEQDIDSDYKETEEEGYRMMFHHTLSSMRTVRTELEATHTMGCKMTLNALKSFILPNLSPLDGMRFDITEVEYADYQVNDPFLPTFLQSMKNLNNYLTNYFNSTTTTQCIQILVMKVVKAIESVALRKKFTLLGGMQFDQIVRNLINFFSSISSKPLRSKFSRLIEIGDLLSLSSLKEFPDLWDLNKNWKLSIDDINYILSCRVDISPQEIKEYLL